jgi:adenine-specific DNA-methyltransferase
MIKKGILNQLIQNHDIKSLEQHLIYSYLKANNLNYQDNPILTDYFNGFEQDQKLYFESYSLDISNIKELENHLELIIPPGDRKLNGAFFTPDYIIDFIIQEIHPKENDLNLDLSCGCGAFLIGLTDYYKRTFGKPIRNIINENIFGSDILPYNIHRTKLLLTIFALQNGEHLNENDFNLYNQDSLRANWKQKFDNIFGNPPYVKFQDLSDDNRNYLAEHWTTVDGGTFNLYFAFFELGFKLLNLNGRLGYITPNNYFTSLSGESLRKYFHQQKCVSRIIDFSHKKVFDAQTYTAITFLSKQQNDSITYDRIRDEQSPEIFLANANGSPNFIENLNVKKWRLLKTDEQQNIKTIETIGKPIGKLFDIIVGIATLKDDVFFVDGSKTKGNFYIKTTETGTFHIEADVVKPVYKISDFKTQAEIEQNTRKIIFPYRIKNGTATAIPESEFKKHYPSCYKYLFSEKKRLASRDKGKIEYEPFYAWGRTQGLTKKGRKILNPTFSQHPRFLLVEEEDSYFTNGYGLFFKDENTSELFNEFVSSINKVENIDVVQKILNSFIMDYYVSKTSVAIEGGYPCYQKNFIEKFSIPELTQDDIEMIRHLSDPHDINEFLIDAYQLNLSVPNLLV